MTTFMHSDVRMVDARNSAKPVQFCRPRMPATAPAKHADKNFTFVREALYCTLGR